MKEGSPPHTRGILPDCLDAIKQAGITPAHAGNTDSNNPEAGTQGDHPRTRGEYVQGFGEIFGGVGSPPHTRGIPMTLLFTKFFNGITPAHAGNTSYCGSKKDNLRDHPRTRGEYDIWDLTFGYQEGSPPHTRGILR